MKYYRKLALTIVIILSLTVCFPGSINAADMEKIDPYSIMSSTLVEYLDNIEGKTLVSAYLFTEEVSEDSILKMMKETNKDYYAAYIDAKKSSFEIEDIIINADLSLKDAPSSFSSVSTNDDDLQFGIELKRKLYAKAYDQYFDAFIDTWDLKSEDVVFQSKLSPMIIVNTTKESLLEICKSKSILGADLFINDVPIDELSVADDVTRAAYVRDNYGNKGAGVKIGQIETNIPVETHTDLTNSRVTCHSQGTLDTEGEDHPTKVARILTGKSYGYAPDAQLYSAGFSDATEFYDRIEWLLLQGVNIINMSAGFTSNAGVYDTISKWVDHIAPLHDVHFVKSAGNSYSKTDPDTAYSQRKITSPGMAYNAITVGGFFDANTSGDSNHGDDDLYDVVTSTSKHRTAFNETASSNRPEKPNLMAPAEEIALSGTSNDSGTSWAAPQVAGTIAQLCSYNSALKTKQTAVGAIFAASSARKISAGGGEKGKSYSIYITGSEQISEVEGAGKLDSRWARGIVSAGNYWSTSIAKSSFPYTKNVTINASSNSLTRVAIFWLKRNSLASVANHNVIDEEDFTNLNLYVYDPSGNLIDDSYTSYSNFEIVQFVPKTTGTYTIKIMRTGTSASEKEHVGIAVW